MQSAGPQTKAYSIMNITRQPTDFQRSLNLWSEKDEDIDRFNRLDL
jgi:hypothetical protein